MRKLKLQQVFKYKKNHLFLPRGLEYKNYLVQNGQFGLKLLENGLLHFKEVESIFKILLKKIKKKGKVFVKGLPFFSATKKPLEVRMGKGKGNPSILYLPVKKGLVLFELLILKKKYLSLIYIKKVFYEVSKRLSLKTKVIRLKL